MKINHKLCGRMDGTQFFMIMMVYIQKWPTPNIRSASVAVRIFEYPCLLAKYKLKITVVQELMFYLHIFLSLFQNFSESSPQIPVGLIVKPFF